MGKRLLALLLCVVMLLTIIPAAAFADDEVDNATAKSVNLWGEVYTQSAFATGSSVVVGTNPTDNDPGYTLNANIEQATFNVAGSEIKKVGTEYVICKTAPTLWDVTKDTSSKYHLSATANNKTIKLGLDTNVSSCSDAKIINQDQAWTLNDSGLQFSKKVVMKTYSGYVSAGSSGISLSNQANNSTKLKNYTADENKSAMVTVSDYEAIYTGSVFLPEVTDPETLPENFSIMYKGAGSPSWCLAEDVSEDNGFSIGSYSQTTSSNVDVGLFYKGVLIDSATVTVKILDARPKTEIVTANDNSQTSPIELVEGSDFDDVLNSSSNPLVLVKTIETLPQTITNPEITYTYGKTNNAINPQNLTYKGDGVVQSIFAHYEGNANYKPAEAKEIYVTITEAPNYKVTVEKVGYGTVKIAGNQNTSWRGLKDGDDFEDLIIKTQPSSNYFFKSIVVKNGTNTVYEKNWTSTDIEDISSNKENTFTVSGAQFNDGDNLTVTVTFESANNSNNPYDLSASSANNVDFKYNDANAQKAEIFTKAFINSKIAPSDLNLVDFDKSETYKSFYYKADDSDNSSWKAIGFAPSNSQLDTHHAFGEGIETICAKYIYKNAYITQQVKVKVVSNRQELVLPLIESPTMKFFDGRKITNEDIFKAIVNTEECSFTFDKFAIRYLSSKTYEELGSKNAPYNFGYDNSGVQDFESVRINYPGDATYKPYVNTVNLGLVDTRTQHIFFDIAETPEYRFNTKTINKQELLGQIVTLLSAVPDTVEGYDNLTNSEVETEQKTELGDDGSLERFELYYINGKQTQLIESGDNTIWNFTDAQYKAGQTVKIRIKYIGGENCKPGQTVDFEVKLVDNRTSGDYHLGGNESYTVYYKENIWNGKVISTDLYYSNYDVWNLITSSTSGSNIPDIKYSEDTVTIEYLASTNNWVEIGKNGTWTREFASVDNKSNASEKVRLIFSGDEDFASFQTAELELTLNFVKVTNVKDGKLTLKSVDGAIPRLPDEEDIFEYYVDTNGSTPNITYLDIDVQYNSRKNLVGDDWRSLDYKGNLLPVRFKFGSNGTDSEEIRIRVNNKVVVEGQDTEGNDIITLYRATNYSTSFVITLTDLDVFEIVRQDKPYEANYNEFMTKEQAEISAYDSIVKELILDAEDTNPAENTTINVQYYPLRSTGSSYVDSLLEGSDNLWKSLDYDADSWSMNSIAGFITALLPKSLRAHEYASGGPNSTELVKITISRPGYADLEIIETVTIVDNRKPIEMTYTYPLESFIDKYNIDEALKFFGIDKIDLEKYGLNIMPVVYTTSEATFKSDILGGETHSALRIIAAPEDTSTLLNISEEIALTVEEEVIEDEPVGPTVDYSTLKVSPTTLDVHLKLQSVDIHYPGDVNYQAGTITVKVLMVPAPADLDVDSKIAVYTEPTENYTGYNIPSLITNRQPSNLDYIATVVGIDGDAKGFASIYFPQSLKDSLTYTYRELCKDLLDYISGNDSLIAAGIRDQIQSYIDNPDNADRLDVPLFDGYSLLVESIRAVGTANSFSSVINEYNKALNASLISSTTGDNELSKILSEIAEFLKLDFATKTYGEMLNFDMDALNQLNAQLVELAEKYPLLDLGITFTVDEGPLNAGVYWVSAISTDINYELSLGLGQLTILPKTEGVELDWTTKIPEKTKNNVLTLSYEEAQEFTYGASIYLDDEHEPQTDTDIAEHVKNIYLQVPGSVEDVETHLVQVQKYIAGLDITKLPSLEELQAQIVKAYNLQSIKWVDANQVKNPGTYVEFSFILGGNYFDEPIARIVKVNRVDGVKITASLKDLKDAEVSGDGLTFTVTYDEKAHTLETTPELNDKAVKGHTPDGRIDSLYFYELPGILPDIPVLDTKLDGQLDAAPTEEGTYYVVSFYYGDTFYENTHQVFKLVIEPKPITIAFVNDPQATTISDPLKLSWTDAQDFKFGFKIDDVAPTDASWASLKYKYGIHELYVGATTEWHLPSIDNEPISIKDYRLPGSYIQAVYSFNHNYKIEPLVRYYDVALQTVDITAPKSIEIYYGELFADDLLFNTSAKAEDETNVTAGLVYVYNGESIYREKFKDTLIPPLNVGTYTITVKYDPINLDIIRERKSVDVELTIKQANVEIKSLIPSNFVYNGLPQIPVLVVGNDHNHLLTAIPFVDYDISYSKLDVDGNYKPIEIKNLSDITEIKDVGTYKVTVTGKGNYTGTDEATFTISPASIGLLFTTTEISDTTYNGTSQIPEFSVVDKLTKLIKLTEDKDYTVKYYLNGEEVTDLTNVGVYTVEVTGKGNYTGKITETFSILPRITVSDTKGNNAQYSGEVDKDFVINDAKVAEWGLADGYYQITVEYGYKTDTYMIQVKGGKLVSMIHEEIPANVYLNVAGDVPAVAKGLGELAKTIAINKGDTLELTLNVKRATQDEINSTKNKFIGLYKDYEAKAKYYSMGVEKSINKGAWTSIPDTKPVVLEIVLPLEVELPQGKMYLVERLHDGQPSYTRFTQIYDKKNAVDGTFMIDGDNIVIFASKFSTYRVSYMDIPTSGPDMYDVIIQPTVLNGSITANHTRVGKQTTVILTVTPDKGYKLNSIKLVSFEGEFIELTDLGNGQYSFKMPTSDVQVFVSFESDIECKEDKNCVIEPFKDTENSDWWHDGIHYSVENEIMNGMSKHKFQPQGTTTRAQIVTMLWRLEGSPVVNYAMKFKDLKDDWYMEAVRWAASTGVVDGYNEFTFGPSDAITREQFAAIMYRYANMKDLGFGPKAYTSFTLPFKDVTSVSKWAKESLNWCYVMGLITGKPGEIVDPQGFATRAEAATMMYRFCGAVKTVK